MKGDEKQREKKVYSEIKAKKKNKCDCLKKMKRTGLYDLRFMEDDRQQTTGMGAIRGGGQVERQLLKRCEEDERAGWSGRICQRGVDAGDLRNRDGAN